MRLAFDTRRRGDGVLGGQKDYPTVATLPLYIHKTRGLSCDHEDAIDATWHRDDAVDVT